MKAVHVLAAGAVLCAIGCEPKLMLELERRGEAYEFELHREGEKRGFGGESFDVMEGARVNLRNTPCAWSWA